MFERFSRSWALIKASALVLRSDQELLLFPLFSAIALIVVVASFLVPAFLSGWVQQMSNHANEPAIRIAAGIVGAAVFGGLTLIAILLEALIQAALSGIYSAALYRYAEHESVGGNFDVQAMAAAFRSK